MHCIDLCPWADGFRAITNGTRPQSRGTGNRPLILFRTTRTAIIIPAFSHYPHHLPILPIRPLEKKTKKKSLYPLASETEIWYTIHCQEGKDPHKDKDKKRKEKTK